MSNWGYLWKFLKSWNFQKWRNFEVRANFFIGSVTENWVWYIDSQVQYLHFELLIDTVAQILTELWWFQNLTYFFTSWPNYLTFDIHNKWVSSDYQDTFLGQNWWWLVQRYDLYPANNVHPDKQTNKQMKGQSEIAYLPKFANMMLIVMVIVITEILYIVLIFDCFEIQ